MNRDFAVWNIGLSASIVGTFRYVEELVWIGVTMLVVFIIYASRNVRFFKEATHD